MPTLVHREKFRVPRLLEWLETEWPFGVGMRWLEQEHEIRCEEYVDGGVIVVRAELPGFDPEKDIDITIRDGVLRIAAERHEERKEHSYSEFFYGTLVRSMVLPAGADESAVTASYHDGILEVTVPLPEPDGDARRIPVARTD